MKNHTLARSLVFVAILLSAVLLIQCAGPVAPPPAAQAPAATQPPAATAVPAGGEQPTTAPAAGEKAKIVYLSMFSEGEPLQKALAQATADFMKENPNIDVEIQWAGRQNLTQLQSLIAGGTQVDIVDHSDDRVYNAIVASDLALPLDKYFDEPAYDSTTPWRDTFVPAAIEIAKAPDGHLYLVARDDYISAFFYNVKMLDELGLKPKIADMSYADFTAMLDAIKAKKPGVAPLGADGTVAFYNNWYFTYYAIRLAGKDAFRDAAYDKTGEKWGAPEFLKAAQMVRELQDKGYFQADFQGSVWPAAQVQWVNDKIAMMFMGAWLPLEMSEQAPAGFETTLFAFPSIEGGKGNEWVEHWANTYGVLKSSQHPDEAVRYLKYIMSPKVAAEMVKLGAPVPLKGVPVPPALQYQYDILNTLKPMPARAGLNTEIPEYMDKVFNPCDDKFFQLQSTPEEFIECLKNDSKAYWATK